MNEWFYFTAIWICVFIVAVFAGKQLANYETEVGNKQTKAIIEETVKSSCLRE